MKKNSYEHYFRNAREENFDNQINTAIYADGNRVEMALYLQNQAIINMLRHLEDEVADIRKQLAGKVEAKNDSAVESDAGKVEKKITFYCKDHDHAVNVYKEVEDDMFAWGYFTMADLYKVCNIPGEPKENMYWTSMKDIQVNGNAVIFPETIDFLYKE